MLCLREDEHECPVSARKGGYLGDDGGAGDGFCDDLGYDVVGLDFFEERTRG